MTVNDESAVANTDVEAGVEVEEPTPSLPSKKPSMRTKGSMLAVSDDPFAAREGKTLLWRNVNMTLVRRKS
jgi:hypothetical protein